MNNLVVVLNAGADADVDEILAGHTDGSSRLDDAGLHSHSHHNRVPGTTTSLIIRVPGTYIKTTVLPRLKRLSPPLTPTTVGFLAQPSMNMPCIEVIYLRSHSYRNEVPGITMI